MLAPEARTLGWKLLLLIMEAPVNCLYLVRLRKDGAHDGDDVGGGGEAVEAEHALELLEAHHRRRPAHEAHDRRVRQEVHDEAKPAANERSRLMTSTMCT
jgi:hypothetical protein